MTSTPINYPAGLPNGAPDFKRWLADFRSSKMAFIYVVDFNLKKKQVFRQGKPCVDCIGIDQGKNKLNH